MRTPVTSFFLSAGLIFGCAKTNTTPENANRGLCVPGHVEPCACLGKTGTQTCQGDSTYGACQCDPLPIRGDGGSDSSSFSLVTFNASARELTAGETVHLVAILTNESGGPAQLSGRLLSDDGSVLYGLFAPLQPGSYQLDLSWNSINQARRIEFATTTEEMRVLAAQFTDSSGHKVTEKLSLRLHCSGRSACTGECTDLNTDTNNCGSCGQVTPANVDCIAGKAGCKPGFGVCGLLGCVDLQSDAKHCGSCDHDCTTHGTEPTQNWCGAGHCYELRDYTNFPSNEMHSCTELCGRGMAACGPFCTAMSFEGTSYPMSAGLYSNTTVDVPVASCGASTRVFSADDLYCCCQKD